MNHDEVAGKEPLAAGMHIVVWLRRDFTVTSVGRLLAAARAAYVRVNPWATADEAATAVTSAADAVFTILESDGLPWHAAGRVLAARAATGLSRADGAVR